MTSKFINNILVVNSVNQTMEYASLDKEKMASDYTSNPTIDSVEASQQQTQEPSSHEQINFSIWNTFKHHIPRVVLTIFIDLILPLVIYFALQKYIQPVYALLLAGAPPLVMVIIKAIVMRTFDALGFLVFTAFLISAIVALVTHNPIILLLEKSIITGVLSLIFGLTLIPLRCDYYGFQMYPLAYYFYHDLVPTQRADVGLSDSIFQDEQEQANGNDEIQVTVVKLSHKEEIAQVYQWIYTHCPSFRSACFMITSIWSLGFLLEFLGRLTLILIHLSVNKVLIYGHVILSLTTILCIILTIVFITKERKETLQYIQRWKRHQMNVQQ